MQQISIDNNANTQPMLIEDQQDNFENSHLWF